MVECIKRIQSEMRSTRSPGARCPSSCLSFLQAVPDQSHNAVILSRVPRSPSRYGSSLSHHRPGKERTRPGLLAFHPTIVPLTRKPVPLQARPVPHTEVPRRLSDHAWWLPIPVRSVCCPHARCARTWPAKCAVARSVEAGVAAGQACMALSKAVARGTPGAAD